jgi:restriction system protein
LRIYLLGTIKSEPQFKPDLVLELATIREVYWKADVRRDLLSVSTRNSLGALMTLFRLSEEAAQEVEAKAQTKAQDKVVEERQEHQGVEDVLRIFNRDLISLLRIGCLVLAGRKCSR